MNKKEVMKVVAAANRSGLYVNDELRTTGSTFDHKIMGSRPRTKKERLKNIQSAVEYAHAWQDRVALAARAVEEYARENGVI